MNSGNSLRTRGFGFLTPEQQKQLQKALQSQKIAFSLVGRGADQEITLLKVSVTGVIPAVIKKLFAAFDIGLS